MIIGWSLYSSYNVFTGRKSAPEIIKIETKTKKGESSAIESMLSGQLREILPADSLPKSLNLAIWSMMVFVLIYGGAQISGIGIKLLKTGEAGKN